MSLKELMAVAKGEVPADLVLVNARIVNTFSAEIETGNVAIYEGMVAGIGNYRLGKQVLDLEGKYVSPGLIDGHVHPESSMLDIGQYARAVVPRGTSAIVTDLHEIANVCGLDGMKYVMEQARRLPLDVFLMVPSCVPATSLETAGAQLSSEDVKAALQWEGVIGLGEMMNFPGVLAGDEEVLGKIEAARGKIIDGHAPGLGDKELNAYLSAGISSDHECTSLEEAREKLRRGMYIMIREGSSEKNLEALLPLVNDQTYKRCLFVVDDRSCADLLHDGDIDAVVRKAIRLGLNPLRAIQMATLNTAEYFRLRGLGAIAPGYFANMIVISDLSTFDVERVFHRGELVARGGQALFAVPPSTNNEMTNTMKVKPFDREALALPARRAICPVIEVVPGQIATKRREEEVKISDGLIQADVARDILKLVVVERHKATGNIGLGLVKGFGLKRGAMASSIAHDSHNIVAVGTNDEDLFNAIKEVERMGGGLVVAGDGRILATLALPIAGLLSPEPLEAVVAKIEELEKRAVELGCRLASSFATLSFLALPVIPELRLTDRGLVDVMTFEFIG